MSIVKGLKKKILDLMETPLTAVIISLYAENFELLNSFAPSRLEYLFFGFSPLESIKVTKSEMKEIK